MFCQHERKKKQRQKIKTISGVLLEAEPAIKEKRKKKKEKIPKTKQLLRVFLVSLFCICVNNILIVLPYSN